VKQKLYQILFWFGICLVSFLPVDASSDEMIKHIRVKHVMDISKDFNQPSEVAVDQSGKIFILDGANNQLKIFSPKGKFIQAVGRFGKGNGEFHNPMGMDVDQQGHVYVADTGNHRIQVFNNTGKYLRKIDLSRWNARPVEVEVMKGTDQKISPPVYVYVSDAKNHQILCFTTDGAFRFSFGGLGEQPGKFRFPGMMGIDQSRDVYVVDILNGRVQIFNPLGKSFWQIGELGVLPGQLFRPKGVVIDDQYHIYVSDSYTGVIQVFEKTGKLRGILSGQNRAFLRLTTPVGMAIDFNKRLYVVQSTLNKVSVFKFLDKGAP